MVGTSRRVLHQHHRRTSHRRPPLRRHNGGDPTGLLSCVAAPLSFGEPVMAYPHKYADGLHPVTPSRTNPDGRSVVTRQRTHQRAERSAAAVGEVPGGTAWTVRQERAHDRPPHSSSRRQAQGVPLLSRLDHLSQPLVGEGCRPSSVPRGRRGHRGAERSPYSAPPLRVYCRPTETAGSSLLATTATHWRGLPRCVNSRPTAADLCSPPSATAPPNSPFPSASSY